MPHWRGGAVDNLPYKGLEVVEVMCVIEEWSRGDQLLQAAARIDLNESGLVAGSSVAGLLPDVAGGGFINGNPNSNNDLAHHSKDNSPKTGMVVC